MIHMRPRNQKFLHTLQRQGTSLDKSVVGGVSYPIGPFLKPRHFLFQTDFNEFFFLINRIPATSQTNIFWCFGFHQQQTPPDAVDYSPSQENVIQREIIYVHIQRFILSAEGSMHGKKIEEKFGLISNWISSRSCDLSIAQLQRQCFFLFPPIESCLLFVFVSLDYS